MTRWLVSGVLALTFAACGSPVGSGGTAGTVTAGGTATAGNGTATAGNGTATGGAATAGVTGTDGTGTDGTGTGGDGATGGTGGDGGSATSSGCVPNCNGKDCGSDGCGGTCGTCVKTEQCQDMVCSAQQKCTSVPLTEAPVCVGMWFTQCFEGKLETLNCIDACKEVGGNFVTDCGIAGASSNECNCYTVDESCTNAFLQCGAGNTISGCLADDGMFYEATCEGVCAQVGLAQSVGCKPDWGCMCAAVGGDGKLCLPENEPCGVTGVNMGCCEGLGCSANGKNAYCKKTKECAKQCVHFETGICCGGALCSGKCVGNPCC